MAIGGNHYYSLDDFEFQRDRNLLISKAVLYRWGYFPNYIWIKGKSRSVEYKIEDSDLARQMVFYISKEENVPNVILKAGF